MQLWRENDSTGLRAEPKLKHTAFAVRVVRKQRGRQRSFRGDTAKLAKRGAVRLPVLFLVMAVFGGSAVPVMPASRSMLAGMAIV
jgi:hypothetical protein